MIDISAYTGMEIEHSHDTAGSYVAKRGVHVNLGAVPDFERKNARVNREVRERA